MIVLQIPIEIDGSGRASFAEERLLDAPNDTDIPSKALGL